MLRKVPLIVILGSTGTGKTKLSLELAERFGGEIISADSMQVYANLNIVTAKATREEQARARHHLLDVATTAEPFTVVNYRNAALPILENLLAQSKCPIVVGGTNYYIESLLWDILVCPTTTMVAGIAPPSEVVYVERKSACEAATSVEHADVSTSVSVSASVPASANAKNTTFYTKADLDATSPQSLHQHLKTIDVESAQRIHPNNKRKIVRAIEVFQQTGETLTSILKRQRKQPGANRLGGPQRYPHTILFWLRCNQDVLNERLDKRVDSMLEQGLLHEIRAFFIKHLADKSSAENPYTKGVLQTIGFKEFIPYLENYNASNDQRIEEYLRQNAFKIPTKDQTKATPANSSINDDDSTGKNSVPPGLESLNNCLNELKLVTRRYSKKQIKWIKNRFLASKDRQVPDLYELDTSNVSAWNELVLRPATTVIDCYRTGQVCELKPLEKHEHPGAGLDEETSHFCTTCERNFIGEYQWHLHLKSNKHKHRMAGQKKRLHRAAAVRPEKEAETQESAEAVKK